MTKTKCEKCGYESEDNKTKFGLFLCNICFIFSPNDPEELDKYISEKISLDSIQPLRKYAKKIADNKKESMLKKASQGKLMSRAPFGYKIEKGRLIPAGNYREVEEIFQEFLKNKISLRKLSQKHNFSVNGLKKILTNFTYIGKIKFNNQIYEGDHEPLISSTLFNHVQNKLERLGIR